MKKYINKYISSNLLEHYPTSDSPPKLKSARGLRGSSAAPAFWLVNLIEIQADGMDSRRGTREHIECLQGSTAGLDGARACIIRARPSLAAEVDTSGGDMYLVSVKHNVSGGINIYPSGPPPAGGKNPSEAGGADWYSARGRATILRGARGHVSLATDIGRGPTPANGSLKLHRQSLDRRGPVKATCDLQCRADAYDNDF